MFILRRFLAFIPVALIVALIVFLMLHLSPGDPVAAIAGDSATAADIARIRAELGLDDPLPEQFVRWCMELIQGDLGRSYFLNRPVADLIADRVGPTLSLAGFTIVLTVLIAVPLGAWAAYRQGGWVDRALMGFSVLGFSIPSFVLGYCFVWLFGLKLNLLPSQGYVRYDESIEGWISHLILPSLTLCCIYVALIARVTRASVAEMLTEDFIRTARAKGITEMQVLLGHALRNAAVPIVTVVGVGIAILIGGVVVTEIVFAIPGLGSLTIDAVMSRDYPLIQGVTLFFSMLYMFINLLIDLSYTLFDPRIREERSAQSLRQRFRPSRRRRAAPFDFDVDFCALARDNRSDDARSGQSEPAARHDEYLYDARRRRIRALLPDGIRLAWPRYLEPHALRRPRFHHARHFSGAPRGFLRYGCRPPFGLFPLGGCRDDARDGWLYVHSGYPLRDQFDRYVRQRFGHCGDRHRHSEYSAHCPTGALRCAVGARGTLR